ncbi:MAG: hypothetical protein FKGGLIKP_00291 [Sodalis sp. Fse]|nr:MAG: hypothetical protein FKGGLIKP_00291 [Sodalis sp. Fse]UVK78778.1 MAG: hypothetical protein IGNPGNKH_00239 [Sodalis sp. Ffu]
MDYMQKKCAYLRIMGSRTVQLSAALIEDQLVFRAL